MPNSGSRRLYDLLDTLVALRLEYADGVNGEVAPAGIEANALHEVRASLDRVIADVKRIVNQLEPPPLLP